MMTCEQADVLVHGLIDGELDPGQVREVDAHVAGCARCAAALGDYREMRQAMAQANLRFAAPAALRRRIEAAIPAAPVRRAPTPSRRRVLWTFGFGAAAAAAAGIAFVIVRGDEDQDMLADAVSAHLRSLQAGGLTAIASSDQGTVKPWFSGKVAVTPPVIDLAAQGFTLLGGRLDTIEGKAVAAIVYRRDGHVINLFVGRADGPGHTAARGESVQGFNTQRWSDRGFRFVAVSDLANDELRAFHTGFEAALRAGT